jgi:transcriptional regulator with XRE-family HTH domain
MMNPDDEMKQREAFFKEFGGSLIRRHGQNYYSSFQNKRRVTVDEVATRFGRWLRSARINAGLTTTELSEQSNISRAKLIALEHGLILTCDIKPRWVQQIADILQEDVETFNLMLGRTTSDSRITHQSKVVMLWQHGIDFFQKKALPKPVYTAVTTILLCVAFGTFFFVNNNIWEQQPPNPHHSESSLVNIAPERRLNIIRAEFGLENQVFVSPEYFGNRGSCCVY